MEPKKQKKRYNGIMSKWCFLRNNQRLKGIIEHEMKYQEIGLRELARRTKIEPDRISRYLNGKTGQCTQFQVISILRELGLNIDLVITKQQ